MGSYRWGATGDIIGKTVWYTDENSQRGDEIQHWLDHNDPLESFVILDDDEDMKHLLPNLILSNFDDGLTEEQANKAIDFLQGNKLE